MTDGTELRKGLEGVLVAESSLSAIDGDAGKLVYRGYAIEDLAREASFEEVLFLLWRGHLPDRDERDAFVNQMASERAVDDPILAAVETLADSDERPMAAFRTAVSMLSITDPEGSAPANELAAARRKGRRLTAKVPTVLAAYERFRRGEDPVEPREDLSHAANFLYMLDGSVPTDVAAETFDMALTLHADHGLNASTFTAMVIASTLADMYSAVTGGIGALSGSLHGGANQDVLEMLLDIDDSGRDPVDWLADKLEEDDWRVPGWGHRVYSVKDPRAHILEEKAADLADAGGGSAKWYEYATSVETYLTDEIGFPAKGIAPNVDFYSGTVYYQLRIPIDLYTPIFAISRIGGWVAHVLEYQEDNRLIRPRARYVGSTDEAFVPIDER